MEFKAYKKKILKIIILSILGIIVALFAGSFIYMRTALPVLDGEVEMRAISKNVKIYRDQVGIPHIIAENTKDAFYSLGYLMASERLFQMEMSRRLASGELSEIIGEKTLASDKMFRNFKIKKTMQEMYDLKISNGSFDPVMQERIKAFYDGVNYFQSSRPLPIEFKILGIKPRPFSVLDGYSFIGLMSFSFAVALSQEPLLTKLEKRIGGALVDEMRVEKVNSNPKTIISEKSLYDHSKISQVFSFLEQGFPLFEGSNGWLIAKSRSATKANMLVNDPHITYSQPGIWFEAHIKTPDYETYGHFLPLIPFPILSHNYDRAWGFTMSLVDDMDLYREKIINDKYVFMGQEHPLKISKEVIKIKGHKDYVFDLLETKHGPVLNQITEDHDLALKWSFLDPENDPIYPLFKMGMARNMTEFKSAISNGIAPGLNVLYADHDNIAWWIFGKVDIKPKNMRSDFILDGTSGRDEYVGVMKFEDKPHSENPASGIIVSANSRPAGFPKDQRGDWQPDDRFKTISTVLAQKELWSVEETKELQTLSMNFENKLLIKELVFDLKKSSVNQKYVSMLENWNLISDIDSPATSIFQVLINKIGVNLLSDLSFEEKLTYGKISTSYIFIKNTLLDHENIWWKKIDRKKIIEKSFSETIAYLTNQFGNDDKNWKWGKLHTLEFMHPLGQVKPLNMIFNIGPLPLSGSTQDINNQKSNSLVDVFPVKAGPSTRRIIDFSNIDGAQGILPQGESGHILSPYYKNQLKGFINGQYRPMLLNLETVIKNKSHYLEFIALKRN